MKKKFIVVIGAVISILLMNFIYFVISFGSAINNQPPLGERILLAISHPSWINPGYTTVAIMYNPFFAIFIIAAIVIAYYLYRHFLKSEEENTEVLENQAQFNDGNTKIETLGSDQIQATSKNRSFKIIVLSGIFIIATWTAFVSVVASGPGMGLVALVFISPVLPIILIFYPVYFIILSVRYVREKSDMDLLDKVTFYILLICIVAWGVLQIYSIPLKEERAEKINNMNNEVIAEIQEESRKLEEEAEKKETCRSGELDPTEVAECFYEDSMKYIGDMKQYNSVSLGLFSGGTNDRYIIREELESNQTEFYNSDFFRRSTTMSEKMGSYQYIWCSGRIPESVSVKSVSIENTNSIVEVETEALGFKKRMQVYLKLNNGSWQIYKVQCPL